MTTEARPQPLLVVRGRWHLTSSLLQCTVLVIAFGAFVGGLILSDSPSTWLDPSLRTAAITAGLLGIFLLNASVVNYLRAREGRVEFHRDLVVFSGKGPFPFKTRLPWQEIKAYDDGSRDFVQLRLHVWPRTLDGGPVRTIEDVAIPTRTEEDRFAVLDLLVKRGIPREGA